LGSYYVLPSETNRWLHVILALDVEKLEKPKLDNVIEKYFDMSVEIIDFDKVVKKIGKKNSIIESAEHGFGILLVDRYLRELSR